MSDTTAPDPADLPKSAAAKLKAVLEGLAANAADENESRPSQEADKSEPAHEKSGPKASLGELIDALDERAYGLLLLLLALPCTLPFVYGLPQIVALPMLALSAQMALGRDAPWLPKALNDREFKISLMQGTVNSAERYLGWIERITHPRLPYLSDGVGGRVVGALLLIPCASILVPLPMTNSTPGVGVAIVAVGLIERDGLLIILGLVIGLIWVFILIFLGAEVVSFAKDWLLARF